MVGSKASSNAGRGAGTMVIAGIVAPVAVFVIPLVIVVSLMTILVVLVQSQYGTTCGSDSLSSTSWVAWAKRIADDDSHGYSQSNRNGDPDYDCSSLVYYALRNAGLDVGSYAFNTTGEPAILEKAGFERHDWTKVADLQTGDVVWQSAHTEIYIGEGRFVGAHQDENGGISGGKAGDQTGDEISVTSYAAGYTAYFRYKGTGNIIGSSGTSNGQAVSGGTGSTELVGMSEQCHGLVRRPAGAGRFLRHLRVRPVHLVDVHEGEETRLDGCGPVLGQWSGLGLKRREGRFQDHQGRSRRRCDHQLARRRAGIGSHIRSCGRRRIRGHRERHHHHERERCRLQGVFAYDADR